jgi:RNA polymerase sigma-70 factor (ECF subfamily)
MTDLPDQTLAELLNQIGKSDDKAFRRLYDYYHSYVYAFVRHCVAVDATAEELTDDVFMYVYSKPQAFGFRANFSTWLCSIGRNKAIDLWRKQKKELFLQDVDEQILENAPDPNWDFVARFESEQDADAVRYCLDRLPAVHREAMFWVYYEDAGLEAVAKHQNCPVGTVKSRLFNARQSMRDCVSRWIEGGRHG